MSTTGYSRLKKRLLIQKLFESGQRLSTYPIQVIVSNIQGPPEDKKRVSILFSVPSKRMKRAVDRNRIKRQMRALVHTNQKELCSILTKNNKAYQIGWVFIGREMPTFDQLEQAIIKLLKQIKDLHEKSAG